MFDGEVLAPPMSSLGIFMWLILTRVKLSLMISETKIKPDLNPRFGCAMLNLTKWGHRFQSSATGFLEPELQFCPIVLAIKPFSCPHLLLSY